MRTTTYWRAGLLAIILAACPLFAPSIARAEGGIGYAQPDTILPWPLFSSRPEDGGFYCTGEFLFWRQTVPLKNEIIAVRGFNNVNDQGPNGANFYGSGVEALNTQQVTGPGSYQPGFRFGMGYKFEDESTVTLSWTHLFQQRYQAVATAAAPNLKLGLDFADSFLTSPVYNFPNEFAGSPLQQTPLNANGTPVLGTNGAPVATYGIWDGASQMTEYFVQRTEAYDLLWRKPIYENECYRFSSILGPRFFWIWEKYDWRTTNFGFTGSEGPSADYSTIDSNRMYGFNVGCSQEWYMGHGFACQLDTNLVGYIDIVKERTEYRLEPREAVVNKRANKDYTVVPEVEAKLSLMWYPTEGVQLKFGYDVMAFFNTIGSERPVDFNYSSIDPKFTREVRFFDGFSGGIAFIF